MIAKCGITHDSPPFLRSCQTSLCGRCLARGAFAAGLSRGFFDFATWILQILMACRFPTFALCLCFLFLPLDFGDATIFAAALRRIVGAWERLVSASGRLQPRPVPRSILRSSRVDPGDPDRDSPTQAEKPAACAHRSDAASPDQNDNSPRAKR